MTATVKHDINKAIFIDLPFGWTLVWSKKQSSDKFWTTSSGEKWVWRQKTIRRDGCVQHYFYTPLGMLVFARLISQ